MGEIRKYIVGILLLILLGLRMQWYFPPRWQPYLWLTLALGISFALVVSSYRLARIADDITPLAR